MRQLFRELKRRNVYRVAATYVVVAFVSLQAVDLLVPATTLPAWADELLVALAVFGFPVALVLAWAFEMTAEGVRRTSEAEDVPEGATGGEGGWIAALVVLLVAAGGAWYLIGGGEAEPELRAGDRSIAVLPFDNLSGTEEAQPFVNGIHDDLLTRLSNISALKVISRTSVLPFRETGLSLPAIADSLGVAWIVEGGVQQAGDQVQVNAQLIQAEEDAHRWAETYRRELTTENLFAVQSELTKKIARSLEAELGPEEAERVERRPTENLDAYKLYVRGRTHMDRRTEAGLRRGMELFQEALARDSSYALAWSGLADARRLLVFYGHVPADSMIPRAREAARRALELDPELAEAHASLAQVHIARQEGISALRHLRRAVELKPSYARAHHWLGNLYTRLGYPEQKLKYLRQAAELDPRSPPIHTSLARVHWWIDGPGDTALGHARRSLELEPDYASGHLTEGLLHADAGRYEEAISALQEALDRVPEGSSFWSRTVGGLGVTYARMGDTARAREELERLERGEMAQSQIAAIHATLGEEEAAFRALEEMEWGDLQAWILRSRPAFDSLRDDPRFHELIRDANRAWGLDPDGSLPDSLDVTFDLPSDG